VAPTIKDTQLTYHVQRMIAKYARHWQSEITRVVHERTAASPQPLTAEEIGECATQVILRATGPREQVLEKLCVRDHNQGKSRPLKEVIRELRNISSR